jgi:choline/glycine/proline betaine transport protein
MEGLKRQLLGVPQTPVSTGRRVSWKQRLRNLSSHPDEKEMQTFVHEVVKPALLEVAHEIRQTGLEVNIEDKPDYVALKVSYGGDDDFVYGVHSVGHLIPSFAFPEFERDGEEGQRYFRAEVYLAEGSQHYDLYGYNHEQLLDDVLIQYEKHMHFLHIVSES